MNVDFFSAQHIALRRRLECARQREGGGGEEGEGVVVRSEDVKSALREVRPSAMREVTVEVPKVHCLLQCKCDMLLLLLLCSFTGVVVRYRWAGRCEAETEGGS